MFYLKMALLMNDVIDFCFSKRAVAIAFAVILGVLLLIALIILLIYCWLKRTKRGKNKTDIRHKDTVLTGNIRQALSIDSVIVNCLVCSLLEPAKLYCFLYCSRTYQEAL